MGSSSPNNHDWLAAVPDGTEKFEVASETPLLVADRGPSHRTWKKTVRLVGSKTGQERLEERTIVEMCDGLHYWEGEWKESRELVEIAPSGDAVATRGQHRAIFAANLNAAAAFDISTPDHKRLRGRLLGLYLTDRVSGEAVQIAVVKDSFGQIVPPNQIIYEDCFAGIRADVRWTYRRGGVEVDVILRQTPRLPEGFLPESTLLTVITEFTDPPAPEKSSAPVHEEEDPAKRARMAQPDLINEDLNFGAMQMRLGHAFAVGNAEPELTNPLRVPVAKHWIEAAGRALLLEQVQYTTLQPLFEGLPRASVDRKRQREFAHFKELLQRNPKRQRAAEGRIQLASAPKSIAQRGVVIDWVLVTSQPTWTFASETTYLVTGSVTISSSTTFQPNCYIKFERNAYLTLSGTVNCLTDGGTAYLVSRDDKSVGEDTSTGSLSGYYANPALSLYSVNNGTTVKRLQIRSASKAIDIYSPGTQTVRDSQFMKCPQGIGAYYTTVNVTDNVMFEVTTQTYSYGFSTFYVSGTYTGGAELNTGHQTGNQAEAAVAINPTDANNIVIVTKNDPGAFFYKMRSTNGGTTWTSSVVADGTDIPAANGDPSLAFDSFGNLYLAYLQANLNTDVVLARSTDKGVTFSVIYTSDGETFCGNKGWPDQPTVVAGPGSNGFSQSVWVLFNRGVYCTLTRELVVTGAGVNGLGQVSSFISPLQIVTGSTDCNFGDIALGPSGQVAVAFQPISPTEGPASIYFCLDSDGLGSGEFGPRSTVRSTNVGAADRIPAQWVRKIDAEVGLAWDRSGGAY